MGCSGGQHGSSRRLCLVLVAGWAGVVGCILAAHDFLPYRELQMSGGSRTSSRSEGTLNGEGHLLGDVGRKRASVGPVASLLRGRLAWCRAGLSHFPGLAGEGALCPVASALCLWPLQSLTGAVVWGLGTLIRSPCQIAWRVSWAGELCSQDTGRGYDIFCPRSCFFSNVLLKL